MHKNAKWIWPTTSVRWDQYAEFQEHFSGKATAVQISADYNYALYLNDTLVFAGQYADFPWYKVYDEIDIAPYCTEGENTLHIVVWHHGKSTMGYYPGNAALCFAVLAGERLVCASGESTPSCICSFYVNGLCKQITGQLGFSYKVDCTAVPAAYTPSILVQQALPLYPRPCARPHILPPAPWRIIAEEDKKRYIIDLSRETAGYLTVDLETANEQEVLISYGEHIEDGCVRRLVGGRDFSVEMRLKPGRETITCPLRRLGLRYIEITAEAPLQVYMATVLPCEYPLRTSTAQTQTLARLTENQRRIYATCVRTLHMCMHEHYEDTPWREQALYAMDSRNQILCGYYAFDEFSFPRANLLLMSKDVREDGLLSICSPSQNDLTIPSFSLHYVTEIAEYTRYSGDCTLAQEVYPKLVSVLSAFTSRMEENLVPVFTENCHWNFYEWSEGLSGIIGAQEEKRFDAVLNCLFAMALRSMQFVADAIGEEARWAELADAVSRRVHEVFYRPEMGLLCNSTADAQPSELVNALAILSGAVQGEEASRIAAVLADAGSTLTKATLSMLCFKYDALLKVDTPRYRAGILAEIEEKYTRMLDKGATTFWETEQGSEGFERAGSLCHGWSAMPIYYYHILTEAAQ